MPAATEPKKMYHFDSMVGESPFLPREKTAPREGAYSREPAVIFQSSLAPFVKSTV
jgi:hypothetical protein